MAKWATWYKRLLIAWGCIALPGLILGIGFSGGEFGLPQGDVGSIIAWLIAIFLLIAPLVLWPWRTTGQKDRLQ
jgi:hypothetical protein